jgi:hypothetical protein
MEKRLLSFLVESMMDINLCRVAYHRQKSGATARGIEFSLTFPEWCEFWGTDIARRGTGPDDLQMQRHADSGAYAMGNIRKGTPRQNAATRVCMERKSESERAKAELELALDALMHGDSRVEHDDDGIEAHYASLSLKSSYKRRYTFCS